MKCRVYTDPKEFCDDTYHIFLRHEAQNAIPLGNALIGKNGGDPWGWRNPAAWFMATVSDDAGKIVLSAIMTPPHNITLYETDNISNDKALECLCRCLAEGGIAVPGVMSENGLAERFAGIYTASTGKEYKVKKNLRLYTLEKVSENIPRIEKIRKAGQSDLSFLPYWHCGFSEDCHMGAESLEYAVTAMQRAIEGGALYVLEADGMAVSMASAHREIVTGRCVGMVYTPPYLRGRGYASSCVAQVSQAVLDAGYQYVCLYTDLANPISNSIYQKIGYKPMCDMNELVFVASDRV